MAAKIYPNFHATAFQNWTLCEPECSGIERSQTLFRTARPRRVIADAQMLRNAVAREEENQ